MNSSSLTHIPEEVLESYLLNRLPGQQAFTSDDPELEAIEIHLLCCEECQDRAEELDAVLEVLKGALKAKRRSGSRSRPKTFRAGY